MAEQRFIIEHEDGRQYSVTRVGFEALYEAEGFRIVAPEPVPDDGMIVAAATSARPLTVKELRARAAELGLDVPSRAKRDDLVAVIAAATDRAVGPVEVVDVDIDRLHGHDLPALDAPREAVVFDDGCRVDPQDDGSWLFTPVAETVET